MATGWPGATVVEHNLRAVRRDELLVFEDDPLGNLIVVVEDVDADSFTGYWLAAIESAHH